MGTRRTSLDSPRTQAKPRTTAAKETESTKSPSKSMPKSTPKATPKSTPAKADAMTKRKLDTRADAQPVASGSRRASLVAVRAVTTTTTTTDSADIVHAIDTRDKFNSMFAQGASVTAGAPTELKFLIDRKSHEIYFIPPKYPFHFNFYQQVLGGTMNDEQFDQAAYNRPDRDFIAGTVTAYDSYVDPQSGKQGQVCFSLWPTDRFDPALLKETHDAIAGGLKFMAPGDDIDFRPGGPIQQKIVEDDKAAIDAEHIQIKSNLDISQGLKYMSLGQGNAVGRLVVIDKGAAMPELGRGDVALFLGDVPPTAPPVAAIITTEVQTYNSHLGIKYRQDKTPYFYKSFSDDDIAKLKALNGKPVSVSSGGEDGTVTAATQQQADDYLKSIKPTGRVRLTPNLKENKARSFSDLAKISVGRNGKWNPTVMNAYGRKTLGVVQLHALEKSGALDVAGPGEPKVVTPKEPMGIPANWYARFMREAKDTDGAVFSDRLKKMTADPRFESDENWRSAQLADFRKAIEKATMPDDLLKDLRDQVAVPYLATHPGDTACRMRSSSPVVEDSGPGTATNKLPNMAGAFDSHSAHWNAGDAADKVAAAMAATLQKDYSSVWNDRAISELLWHNVDLDEGSVAMAVLVMPNEEAEKANGVVRVNNDLAGFFSITGETQFGENLVTNPEQGATPDTWIDGNYDVLNGQVNQDIEYERVSNQKSPDPNRPHAYTDGEISVVYKAMKVIRDHFAKLEGKDPNSYNDECETKILADGTVQFKQERPWVE
jgi:hypothetical protein